MQPDLFQWAWSVYSVNVKFIDSPQKHFLENKKKDIKEGPTVNE